MTRDHTKMHPLLLAIPVLIIGLQDSAAACISAAIASICAAYPEVPIEQVQLLVTLPSVAVCIVSLFYGWLSVRINPRTLVIVGLCLFCIGGISPAFIDSFQAIFACRIILGIGAGLTLPAGNTIIPRLYDGQMRANMIGWNMAVGSIGCTVMVFIGGLFAETNWHYSFLGYCVGLVSLVIVVALLPKIPMVKEEKTSDKPSVAHMLKGISPRVWGIIAVYFIGNMFATMVTSNLSLFIEGAGIGTPAITGTALSVQMIGAAIGAGVFGLVRKKAGWFVIPIAWLILGLGYLVVVESFNVPMICLGMMIAGAGVGMAWPAYSLKCTEKCGVVSQATAVAVLGAVQGFGNFFQPVIGAWCVAFLGIGFGYDLIVVSEVVLLGLAVATFVCTLVSRFKTAENNTNNVA